MKSTTLRTNKMTLCDTPRATWQLLERTSCKIPCILGSATPSLETLHNVDRKRYSLHKLSHRPGTAEMPKFNVLDIRGHYLEAGLSPVLVAKIKQHLDADAQVLILINRRGYAKTVYCLDCGWKATCD